MQFDLNFVLQRGKIGSFPVKMAMSIAMVMMLVAEVEVHCGAKDGVDGVRMVLRVRGGATLVFPIIRRPRQDAPLSHSP